jgi:16S rRNA (guanine(966)-N(2))-methyltransferase RsmD
VRIIGGKFKGKQFRLPKDLPVRPTTDFAKEGLFNILNHRIDLEGAQVLDLFSGTGHISLECASRGAKFITAVDSNFKCAGFLRSTANEIDAPISAVKADVFTFLKANMAKYDLIFADPPYEMPNITEIHSLVFERKLLADQGWLIIEHGPRTKLEDLAGFVEHRKYGNVNFSFFQMHA